MSMVDHGFPRATAELDIWLAMNPGNAGRVASALLQFGFAGVEAGEFLEPREVVHMGVPPVRLDRLTSISGVEFANRYARRLETKLDETPFLSSTEMTSSGTSAPAAD